MAKQGTLREIYSITDYEPLCLSRFRRLYEEIEAPGAASATRSVFAGGVRADPRRPQFRLLDLLSVRFVAVPVIEPELFLALERRGGWQSVPLPPLAYRLYEHADVLPRAYVAFDAERVAGEDAAFAAITDGSFDPRRRVVLEDGAAAAPAPNAAAAAIVPARITEYAPTRVVVETDAAADGHLVLTDTFYPGWRATVDDTPRPIVQANYLFRAVDVPAGRHRVTFRYAPASFTVGALITGATIATTAAAALWTARTRRIAAVSADALEARAS